MKKLTLAFLSSCMALNSFAMPVAVQRSTESSYTDYQKYIEKNGYQSFAQAFIQLSSVTEMETPLLEKCLEEIYIGAQVEKSCLAAVKSLTSKPLNSARRDVLFSFLLKVERIKTAHQSFYRQVKQGLLKTHPELARTFQTQLSAEKQSEDKVLDLEMKAWKKAVGKMFPMEEVALLINGKKISKLENWIAPPGVYQWALITNTHEPIIRLATFSQFANGSLKELKPLAKGGCDDLKNWDEKNFGLLRVEVFANPKCVTKTGLGQLASKSEHLGNSAARVQMENSSQRHWVWPLVVLAGVGLASSLKNKQVSVEWPSLR